MPKRVVPLSPSKIANAKPTEKPYVLRDGHGLLLSVEPGGGKLWRIDYRRPDTGKRNMLSLGAYPAVSLKRAREKRDEARALLADGIDPGDKRKAETLANADTFEAIAREWFAKFSTKWAKSHADKVLARLENDVFPWLGSKPVAKITAPDFLGMLKRIEARGAIETAHRASQNCGQVMRYAVATGRAPIDPTPSLRGSLTPWKPVHYPSITEPKKYGELLRAIDGFTGTLPVKCALRLLPLVFTRPGELRAAEWAEFDLDEGVWNIPAERMKLRLPHVVPLAPQAVEILRELQPLTGRGRYVFPGARSTKQPLSDMALNAGLRPHFNVY